MPDRSGGRHGRRPCQRTPRCRAAQQAPSVLSVLRRWPPPLPLLGRSHFSGAGAGVVACVGALVEDLVDYAERLGFVGLEELVAVHRLLDLLDLLAGVLGVKLVEALTHAQDLARLDLNV